MHATTHIPFEKCTATLWVNIDVLLIAFDEDTNSDSEFAYRTSEEDSVVEEPVFEEVPA